MPPDSPDIIARVDPAQSAAALPLTNPLAAPLPGQEARPDYRTSDPDWIPGTGRALSAVAAHEPATQNIPAAQTGQVPSRPIAAVQAPAAGLTHVPTLLPPAPARAGDEEYALLYVLRLIDRVIRPGTLSPVERAFVTGAKVMLDHLSGECQRMLDRKVSDVARVSPKTPRTLKATGSTPHTKTRQPKVAPKPVKASPKSMKASPKPTKAHSPRKTR
jgi:hypothetical protein